MTRARLQDHVTAPLYSDWRGNSPRGVIVIVASLLQQNIPKFDEQGIYKRDLRKVLSVVIAVVAYLGNNWIAALFTTLLYYHTFLVTTRLHGYSDS